MEPKPILLNRHTCALIFIYKRTSSFTEMALSDYEAKDMIELQRKAAKEFIEQLQGEWCVDFMEKLRDEINERLREATPPKEKDAEGE